MPQTLTHSVYFTLQDPSTDSRDRFLAACQEYLTDHPGCLHCAIGTLAEKYDRPVNDRDFDVAIVAVFESEAAHDAYQVSERHKQFLAEQAANWSQVRVFDVLGA